MADLEDKGKAEKLAAGRKRVNKDTWNYVFMSNIVLGFSRLTCSSIVRAIKKAKGERQKIYQRDYKGRSGR